MLKVEGVESGPPCDEVLLYALEKIVTFGLESVDFGDRFVSYEVVEFGEYVVKRVYVCANGGRVAVQFLDESVMGG